MDGSKRGSKRTHDQSMEGNGADDERNGADGEGESSTSNAPTQQHYLTARIIGVVCNHPNCRGKRVQALGNPLWPPTRRAIKGHFAKYNCGPNNPNYSEIARELQASQLAIIKATNNNPTDAQREIEKIFPSDSTLINGTYCSNCGHVARSDNIKSHFKNPDKGYRCIKHIHLQRGSISVNSNGMKCAQSIITKLMSGEFSPPYVSNNNNEESTQPADTNTTANTTYPVASVTNDNNMTAIVQEVAAFKPIFTSSKSQMTRAKSNNSTPLAVNNSQLINTVLKCFVDERSTNTNDVRNLEYAKMHLTLLAVVVDHSNVTTQQQADVYFRELANQASKQFSPNGEYGDNESGMFGVLNKAGRMWMESEAADNDVRRITALFRAMLYQVGTPDVPNEEILLQGSTFTPTGDMDAVVTEWTHFLLFILRRNPNLIKQQLMEAKEIYQAKLRHHQNEQDAAKDAAENIVDTNIIFAILMQALFEEPTMTNGANTLHLFIVGRSIITPTDRTLLKFKHANGIGE